MDTLLKFTAVPRVPHYGVQIDKKQANTSKWHESACDSWLIKTIHHILLK